jgi:GLPGLI family protein
MRFILTYLLFTISLAFSQEKRSIECIYKISVKDFTSEELNSIKDENIKTNLINRLNFSKKREFVLKGNRENAIFLETASMQIDNDNNKKNYTNNDSYFYASKLNKVFYGTEFSSSRYLVEYPFDYYNWKISNETKIIDGFKCYKASGVEIINDFREKKEYVLIAWFCPELPFKFGPDKYFGLPGLIFEAFTENSKEKFVLKSIKINDEEINIEKPKGTEITEAEFTKIFNETMKSLYGE